MRNTKQMRQKQKGARIPRQPFFDETESITA